MEFGAQRKEKKIYLWQTISLCRKNYSNFTNAENERNSFWPVTCLILNCFQFLKFKLLTVYILAVNSELYRKLYLTSLLRWSFRKKNSRSNNSPLAMPMQCTYVWEICASWIKNIYISIKCYEIIFKMWQCLSHKPMFFFVRMCTIAIATKHELPNIFLVHRSKHRHHTHTHHKHIFTMFFSSFLGFCNAESSSAHRMNRNQMEKTIKQTLNHMSIASIV